MTEIEFDEIQTIILPNGDILKDFDLLVDKIIENLYS